MTKSMEKKAAATGGWSGVAAGSLARRLLDVPAELVAHRREQLVGELGLAARGEAIVKRCRQHVCRRALVDCSLDRPAPLTRVGNSAGEAGKLRILCEGIRRQVQEP